MGRGFFLRETATFERYGLDLSSETIELARRVCPEALRARHILLLGTSRDTLPSLLADVDHVDIFFHDSDHSYANMTWEFETAWPKVGPDGLLVSDDVLANTAFFDFCRKASLNCLTVFNLGVGRRSGCQPAMRTARWAQP